MRQPAILATWITWASLSIAVWTTSSSTPSSFSLSPFNWCKSAESWVTRHAASDTLSKHWERELERQKSKLCSTPMWSLDRMASVSDSEALHILLLLLLGFSGVGILLMSRVQTTGPRTHQASRPGTGEEQVPWMGTWRMDSQHKVQSEVTHDVTCSNKLSGGTDSAAETQHDDDEVQREYTCLYNILVYC